MQQSHPFSQPQTCMRVLVRDRQELASSNHGPNCRRRPGSTCASVATTVRTRGWTTSAVASAAAVAAAAWGCGLSARFGVAY